MRPAVLLCGSLHKYIRDYITFRQQQQQQQQPSESHTNADYVFLRIVFNAKVFCFVV